MKADYSARKDWVVDLKKTAILLVDVQNSEISAEVKAERPGYYQRIKEVALPNQIKIVDYARSQNIEVMYTVIEALTQDGRDRSLDHKLSDFLIPKGSDLAKVISDVAPVGDEMVLPKTSSGVFNSTNIDYVLNNLNIETLIVFGFLTDQCVDMAVRDAADRGYFVMCVGDACATYSEERHENGLNAIKGYCDLIETRELLLKLENSASD